MFAARVTAIALALSFAARPPGLAQQPPRLEVTPATVLSDERFRVTLDGVKPAQDVTIRVDGVRGVWRSSATFRSDDRGRVEVGDPMRLIWSATGDRPMGGPGMLAQPWTFTAEVDGQVVATQTIVRRAVAENVRIVPIRDRGLVGTAYYPPGDGPHPAMIVLPGSQGGIPGPGAHAGGLASRGYAVLALAYFNAEGLPPLLQNIPLEYFATAAEWLKAQPSVDATRIGVLGTSRGGELALLLGATYPSAFRVVVANVPSNVVWPGLSNDTEVPAWTLNGEPVPAVPGRFTAADHALSGRERFLKRLHDPRAVARAEIPVERINAPVLLLSAKDDQLWPSDLFAARVVQRLEARGFKHPVEHYSYENAGHQMTRPFGPTSDVRQVRIHPLSKRPNMMGGTPEGQARANEESWHKLLAFLDKHLRPQPPAAEPDWTRERGRMVIQQLRERDVRSPRVLEAMRSVPRHRFVPEPQRPEAYGDFPLPIGHGQTISQPYIVAFMTESLDVGPADRVLEIGTGSGYQAAVLSLLAKDVYTIEIVEPLATRARATLAELGYRNVHVRTGNGYLGWPEHAPYDRIMVTAAPDDVPPALVQQLKVGGLMAIPVGTAYQELRILRRTRNGTETLKTLPVRFVPMVKKPK